MIPPEFFHDHPVIDHREDGYHIYFSDLPPILLDNPIHLTDEDDTPDEDDA